MELADAAEGEVDVDRYHPATLAARIGEGKALEITDCLRIAESLAGALAFLHEQGLIHRDVKPSNILYVGGVPKLGDIGLVAEAGSSRSYVGTEGFVPLEGAGAFHAKDIRVFDLTSSSDEPVHVEASGAGSFPAFSPDGKWLACSGNSENRILRAGTWTLEHRRPRRSGSLAGYIGFSSGSRLMTMLETTTRCVFIEPGTWRTLYHLDSPLDEIFERCALSASGRYFAAVGTRQEIYVWDLQALERKLTALGLGVPRSP